MPGSASPTAHLKTGNAFGTDLDLALSASTKDQDFQRKGRVLYWPGCRAPSEQSERLGAEMDLLRPSAPTTSLPQSRRHSGMLRRRAPSQVTAPAFRPPPPASTSTSTGSDLGGFKCNLSAHPPGWLFGDRRMSTRKCFTLASTCSSSKHS